MADTPNGLVEVFRAQGAVHEHSLLLPAFVVGPEGRKARVVFVLDTGAFEPLIYSPAAAQAGLPRGQAMSVGGVGGASPAYESTMALEIGGVRIGDVACVVDDSSPDPLLGYRMFEALGYVAEVYFATGLLVVYRPAPAA